MFPFSSKMSVVQRHQKVLQKRAQRRRQMRRLLFEGLENRTLLATFAEVGSQLNLDMNVANKSVGIVSGGTSYTLTLTGDTWSGTNSINVTGNGTTSLIVTPSGLGVYDTVNISDSATGSAVNFNNSGANSYGDAFNISLDNAAGTITFNGASSFVDTAALSASTSRNIILTSGTNVSTSSGSITLQANDLGTTTGNFVGISLTRANITSSGIGAIHLIGKGGDTSANNYGVYLASGSKVVGGSSGTAVTIDGTGGNSGDVGNYGVFVNNTGTVVTASGGAVQITGQGGGSGSSTNNFGVRVSAGGQITAGGNGAVTVTGKGSNSGNGANFGTILDGVGSSVTSSGGAVQVAGQGGGSAGAFNYGVYVVSGGQITAGGSGPVRVVGTGGGGGGTGGANIGVRVEGSGARVTSSGGNVQVIGQGGDAIVSANSPGVYVSSGGEITAGAAGTVTIMGTGAGGSPRNAGANYGVVVEGSGAKVTSSGGAVQVNGQGGASASGDINYGVRNYGVFVTSGGQITAGSQGSVTVFGTGGGGSEGPLYGVLVEGSGSIVTSSGGTVQITGQGGFSNNYGRNHGALVRSGGQITAGGAGTVTLTGTGGKGSGDENYGVVVEGSGSSVASSGGAVEVTGQGGGSGGSGKNVGVYVFFGGQIAAGGSATVSVTGTGGNSTGISNHGLLLQDDGIRVTSGGGDVQITGTPGNGSSRFAISIASSATISTALYGGAISLIGDSMDIDSTAVVNAGTNTVSLKPRTTIGINLGGPDASGILGLTDGELDRITARVVTVGNSSAGAITISSAINPAKSGVLHLLTGSSITQPGSLPREISVAQFAAEATGDITLSVSNDFGKAAARSTTGAVYLNDANNLTLGEVNGLTQVSAATNLTLVTQNGNLTVENTAATDELVATNLTVILYGAETVFEQLPGSRLSATNQAGILADKMKLAGQIAADTVQLQPRRAGLALDLGSVTDNAMNTLELSDAELSAISAGTLRIGDGTSGIAISAPLNAEGAGRLWLKSNGGLSQTAPVTQTWLIAEVSGSIVLDGANDVDLLALASTSGGIVFRDLDGFVAIRTDGQPAVNAPTGSVTLTSLGGVLEVTASSPTNALVASGPVVINVESDDAKFRLGVFGTLSGGSSVTITADKMEILGSISAAGQTVTLRPWETSEAIVLGSTTDTAADALELSDAELDRITAGTLSIGSTGTGTITISQPINPAVTTSISLLASGGIVDGNTSGSDVTVANLNLDAASVGAFSNPLETTVSQLQVVSRSGGIYVSDSDGLIVSGALATGAGISLSTAGPLSVTGSITASSTTNNVNLISTGSLSNLSLVVGQTVSGPSITLQADRMNIAGSVIATLGAVQLNTASSGWGIDLGSGSDAASNTLELSDAELDRITAGTLQIGDTSSGNVKFSGPVDLAGSNTLEIITGGDITQGFVGTALSGDTLILKGDLTPGLAGTGNFIANGPVTFDASASYEVNLNGPANYDQLVVAGNTRTTTLGGADLMVTLDTVPSVGSQQVFRIVDSTGSGSTASGTFKFSGMTLNDGDTFTVGSTIFRINYNPSGSTGDVTLTEAGNTPPIVDLNGINDAGVNFTVAFVEDAGPKNIGDSDATITDAENSSLASLTLVVNANPDGADETLVVGGIGFPLNASQTSTALVLSSTFQIAYDASTRTFNVIKNGGGMVPIGDLQTLLRGITYNNADNTPTTSNRTIAITANDGIANSFIATATITVTAANDVPTIINSNLTLSLTTIPENQFATLAGSFADPDTADFHIVTIDWGDGSTDTSVNLGAGVLNFTNITHQYLDDNLTGTGSDPYTISVSVIDTATLGGTAISTSGTATTIVTVTNENPVANAGADQTGNEGTGVTLNGAFTDVGINDGHKQEWSVVASNGQIITGLIIDNLTGDSNGAGGSSFGFTPTDNGTYTVSYQVTDDDGGVQTDTAIIIDNNVIPVLDTLSATSVFENGTVHLTGTYHDVGSQDTHSLTINWGEGTTQTVVVIGGTFDISHQYLDDNPTGTSNDVYTIGVILIDDDGGTASAVDILSERDDLVFGPGSITFDSLTRLEWLDVTASINRNFTQVSNQFGIAGDFAGFRYATREELLDLWGNAGIPDVLCSTRPNRAPIIALQHLIGVTRDLGSQKDTRGFSGTLGSVGGLLAGTLISYDGGGEASFINTGNHADPSTGSFLVRQASPAFSATTMTTITNVAPVILTLGATSVNENGTVTLSGTFSDVGTQDTHMLTINWGEGVPVTYAVAGSSFSFTHQYLDDNPTNSASDVYTIGVTLTDDDTGSVSSSTTTTITNVAPVILTLAATSVNENGTVTLSGTYSDVGSQDTHTLTINWGEGSPVTYPVSGGSFSFTHQYLDDNPTNSASDVYTIGVTLTDDDTGSVSSSTTTTITNVAPMILTLSATSVNENGTVTLSGTYSDVGSQDTHTLTINWGEDSSVTYPVTNGTFSFTHQYLDDNPTNSASDVYTIGVTLTDDDTGSVSSSTTTTITNVAPVLASLANSSPDCGHAFMGVNAVTIGASFTDVGLLDTHKVSINWGDGITTIGSVIQGSGSGSISGSHIYANGGIFKITVTLTDDDGGSATSTTTAVITGIGVVGNTLYVIGTDSGDRVTINQAGSVYRVHADFLATGTFRDVPIAGISRIVVQACGGNDQVTISSGISIPALIDGGTGDDKLNGGNGTNIIIGGDGNDDINGGNARDILIGGKGSDRLVGNGEEDVLIAGWTDYDKFNPISYYDSLWLLMMEWNRSSSQADRRGHITGTSSGGLNGSVLLNSSTVHDDLSQDKLTGSSGIDWFFANLSGGAFLDVITDRSVNELLEELT